MHTHTTIHVASRSAIAAARPAPVERRARAHLGALLTLSAGLALTGCVSGPPDEAAVDRAGIQFPTLDCAMKSNEAGGVDTGLAFSSFWTSTSSFTLATWVMPEWNRGDVQPALGDDGGAFALGLGSWRTRRRNGNEAGCGDTPVLRVRLGSRSLHYLAPGSLANAWHHLALRVVRQGDGSALVTLFFDGAELQPFSNGGGSDCATATDVLGSSPVTVTASDMATPAGTLQLGEGAGRFFYGLIDHTRVDKVALTLAQITTLAASGSLPGRPLWQTTFDHVVCAGALGGGTARRVLIDGRDGGDAARFRDPTLVAPTETAMHLPFEAQQVWRVTQGFGGRASHNGSAAFCWDMARGGETALSVVHASMAGELVHVEEDDNPAESELESNRIWLEAPNGETVTYLHLEHDSVTEQVFGGVPPLFKPDQHNFTVPVADDSPLARVAANDRAHLHFCLRPRWDLGYTTPSAFVDYQVAVRCDADVEITSDTLPRDHCWKNVARGIPAQGTWIRRP